ncbi:MAG TPA: translesion DNA synthesis-associated protein ImuA [Dokdonella sp.]|nr:translesion DNA synthesis-associated protein ImuA [Dokdonella sp.]
MFTTNLSEAAANTGDYPLFAPPVVPVPSRAAAAPARRDETALADVLRHPGIWRRGTVKAPRSDALATGLAELDALLPGGGWPRGALSEILVAEDGLGECSLLLPALATLTQARQRVVLVAPPYIPYAPALAAAGVDLAQLVHIDANASDTHWTAEQCLRAGCCGAVLNWLPRCDYRQLRRLQLAAETGGTFGFVFRPLSAAHEASPAALRLRLEPGDKEPRLEILKCRGRFGEQSHALGLRA